MSEPLTNAPLSRDEIDALKQSAEHNLNFWRAIQHAKMAELCTLALKALDAHETKKEDGCGYSALDPHGYLWFDKNMEHRFTHRAPTKQDGLIGDPVAVYLKAQHVAAICELDGCQALVKEPT